jgi:two-component system OmpR family response regulator
MRVLVVDDEVRLARALRPGLEAAGFAVDVAHNGTDGLWLAREHSYDAIVRRSDDVGAERQALER